MKWPVGSSQLLPSFSPLRTRVAHPQSSLCTMGMAAATVHFWGPSCILASLAHGALSWPLARAPQQPQACLPETRPASEPGAPVPILCLQCPRSPIPALFALLSDSLESPNSFFPHLLPAYHPLGAFVSLPCMLPIGGSGCQQLRENAQLFGTRKSLCGGPIRALRSHNFSRLSSQLSFKSPSLPACARFCAAPQRKLP